MQNSGKWLLGIAACILVIMFFIYNHLVNVDENVNSAWSEVQNQLKRRNDLIPNLVNTVQGYASHERGVFEEVTKARAKVSQAVKIDVSELANNPVLQKQLLDAQQNLNSALGRLIAVAENYPNLKSSENFLQLQNELAGTENRIAVARGRAINNTRDFNKSIRIFPSNIFAGFFGFTAKKYYEAPENEQKVPTVDFQRKKG
ncbi:MAG: LemA family protein [Candidatus Moranbacteria bacterium]|nr:LemA family protein [Candidatus Moranbacteria bacterium]